MAQDQYCVPKISLSAIDLVKKVPYMKVTTKVVKAELAKSYMAQDQICRLSSFVSYSESTIIYYDNFI